MEGKEMTGSLLVKTIVTIVFLLSTFVMGYLVEQSDFWQIMGCYVPFFISYVLLATRKNSLISEGHKEVYYWILIALICRVILVFSLPNLSNDIYRFIWDGRLLVNGYNPFDHLPMYYLENNINVPGIGPELFEAFDAKNFYTVYPPVAQAQFGSAVWLFPQDIHKASIVMKLWLLLFEVGSIYLMLKLLRRMNLPEWNVLWYALNPLIIFEITGNLHFEGAMIFFLLLSCWLLPNRLVLSGIAFALSICAKLLTILFLPFFVRLMGWKKAMLYFILIGLATILFFIPIVNSTFIANFGDSLNLYFQKLEFNASWYYIIRWIFFHLTGYNQIAMIGPILGLVAMGGILWMAFFKKNEADDSLNLSSSVVFEWWLFSICLYLFCTTTLHPWYLAMPVAFCVFTQWRFPILWSGVIFLTYINYSCEPYYENLWVVALEYVCVFGMLIWEWSTQPEKLKAV